MKALIDGKKAAVLGVGRMGQAICYAMNKLGFYVIGVDSNKDAVEPFRKYVDGIGGVFYLTDEKKGWDRALSFEKPDVVISSLPYHQTEKLASWCIDKGFRYCDLGGRIDVSHRINEYAKEKASKPVFTDLGLAPGWVNILAEHGCKQIHTQVDSVKMLVGGLPTVKVNHPLDYIVTWSIDGLINEYKDNCEILQDGKIKLVKGMDGLESVDCGILGNLEAFYTSGGASHTVHSMKEKGVKNCVYKTLRYKGHRDVVRFLMEYQSEDCVREAFERGCRDEGGVGDVVLMKVFVDGGDVEWKKELAVFGGLSEFSAMQKATAFPAASVASLMAEGFFDKDMAQRRGYWEPFPRNLSYNHVPYGKFGKRLSRLGIEA
jgi:saccharopine dehydrogenase-like NADP-dependent oxidoreductase